MLGAVGARPEVDIALFEVLPGVQEVHRISSPYKLAGRSFRPERTIVQLSNGVEIGGKEVIVMAGPCSVESRDQIFSSPNRWLIRVPESFAAAHSSRARLLIHSRAWAKKA